MLNRFREFVTGPTFRSRMEAAIAETGWSPTLRRPDCVYFHLSYGGRGYEFSAEAEARRVVFTAYSNARFGLRCFPPILEEVLVRRNRELDKFDWKLFHGRTASWPVLVASARVELVDVELVRFVADHMLAEVEQLDDGLRERGLAR